MEHREKRGFDTGYGLTRQPLQGVLALQRRPLLASRRIYTHGRGELPLLRREAGLAGRQRPCNDLATTYPRLAREWDAERNGGLTPSEVVAGSDRRVYWKCIKGHRWRTTISSRASGGCDCPYCLGTRVIKYPAIAESPIQE